MAKNKCKQKNPNRMASSETPPPPPPPPPQQQQPPARTRDDREAEKQEEETFTYAMQLANASVLPLAMKTAIDLGVFEILAAAAGGLTVAEIAERIHTGNPEEPDMLDRIRRLLVSHRVSHRVDGCDMDDNAADGLTVEEIAERIHTGNPEAPAMLDRILRLLVSHRVVRCDMDDNVDGRKYSLSDAGKYFARDDTGVSLAPLLALTLDKVYSDSWSHLKDAILEGGVPFNQAHGAHLFDYLARDARFSQVYNTAMFNHTTLVFKNMLRTYSGFESCKQIVDVGGGIGVALSLITSKYPSIKGINFDLPHVIKHAPPFPGVKHVEGDMFKSVPKGDAIILKWILHDWDDEHCLKLLKNCYRALPADGKVVIVEKILPIFPESFTLAAQDKSQVDMLSLTQSSGGKERLQHEIFKLAASAGFPCIAFPSCVYDYWVLEFTKKS